MKRRDPVEERSAGTQDLYDISTWEPRTALDRLAERVYRMALAVGRWVFILVGLLILVTQFLLGGIGATFTNDPYAIGLVVLSVIPALALVGYIYVADVTSGEPLELLVGTFILGVVFAGFAAIVNGLLSFVQALPIVGMLLFFYLVVAPIEETVKLLAIRLYAYRDNQFDAVIDGAVYGAVAGLGFATIENALYITRQIGMSGGSQLIALGVVGAVVIPIAQVTVDQVIQQAISQGGGITAVRALAGPGHVIYSAFAGYYLGLAKFNRQNAGPIAVKGLLIAAFIHATYNTLVGIVPALVSQVFPNVSPLILFFGFVVVYDGLFGYILYRKIARYSAAYKAAHRPRTRNESQFTSERTEFEE